MMQNLTVNTVQLTVNQVLGLVIFYILSAHLDKNSFGQINLALAILLAAFSILSMGIDQLTVKQVAAGHEPRTALTLYLGHVLWTGLIFYVILFLGDRLWPHLLPAYYILLLLGIAKLAIYWVSPFKQVANGLERFRLLGVMSVISNIIRGSALVLLACFGHVEPDYVIMALIAGDVAEFAFGILLFSTQTPIAPLIKFDKAAYLQTLKLALPQAGVVIITSALARFDWIFIGLVSSPSKLAEYSFAYKVYELSTLPLLALAPLLVPRFTKMIKENAFALDGARALIRLEMVAAAFTVLILNVYWSPLVDGFTGGKYGVINQHVIFILSLSVPVVYINNFLWTMYFAQGRLKMIFHSFVLAVIINISLDVLLIPAYQNEGAAMAVLISLMAQCLFFIRQNNVPTLRRSFYAMPICMVCALAGLFVASQIPAGAGLHILIACGSFFLLMILFRQLTLKELPAVARFFNQ